MDEPAFPPRSRVVISRVSLRRLRWSGQLTRLIVCGAATTGLLASARLALLGPPVVHAAAAPVSHVDVAAAGFASLFARRFLTWDASRPGDHAQSLAALVGSGLDPDVGLRLPASGSERVAWTEIVQDRPGSIAERVYTVAAQTDSAGLVYLSVAVRRLADGRLALSRYPSFVGSPAVAPATPGGGPEVTDGALATVVGRALGNYLAGSRANLDADLASGTHISLPPVTLVLRHVMGLRWSPGGGAVQAVVDAQDSRGAGYTLTYELDVLSSRTRWEISAIQMDPTA